MFTVSVHWFALKPYLLVSFYRINFYLLRRKLNTTSKDCKFKILYMYIECLVPIVLIAKGITMRVTSSLAITVLKEHTLVVT